MLRKINQDATSTFALSVKKSSNRSMLARAAYIVSLLFSSRCQFHTPDS